MFEVNDEREREKQISGAEMKRKTEGGVGEEDGDGCFSVPSFWK